MVFLTGEEYFNEIINKLYDLIHMLDENPDEAMNKEAGELEAARHKIGMIRLDYLKHIEKLKKEAENTDLTFEF